MNRDGRKFSQDRVGRFNSRSVSLTRDKDLGEGREEKKERALSRDSTLLEILGRGVEVSWKPEKILT